MIKYPLHNQAGELVGEVKLVEKIFALKINTGLLHQAVKQQLNNARQTIAHAKTRSEVRGGGRKPWRQKGTGRARVGSIRSPLWRGGGAIFGPQKERNFSQKLNQKMRQAALWQALSDKVASRQLVVLDKLELTVAKTKAMQEVLKTLNDKLWQTPVSSRRSLLLLGAGPAIARASRNLTGVTVLNLNNLNVVDLLKRRCLLTTQEAVKQLQKKYQT